MTRVRPTWLLLLAATACSGERTTATPSASAPPVATPIATPVVVPSRPEPAVPAPATEPAEPAGLATARAYTAMFYRGELDLLHAKFSPEMREQIPLERLSTIHEHMLANYGKERRIIGEDSQRNEDYRAFVRWAAFDKTDQVIEVQWILRADSDEVAGFFIRPAARKVRAESDVTNP